MYSTRLAFKTLSWCQSKRLGLESCRFLAVRSQKMAGNNDSLEKLKANPFFEKYSGKINEFQKTSPEEFQSKLNETKKKQTMSSEEILERPFSQLSGPKININQSYSRPDIKLESIMKTELIKDKTAEEITKIWKEYHQSQEKISAVIAAQLYSQIFERSKKFPIFLFPLPRSQGYEFIVSAIENHNCYFTTLINYQAYKENSPPCLTINHYPDYMEAKGIVLMRGEYDKNVLNALEAQCLANQLQLYYTAPVESQKYSILKTFNYTPNSFKHAELIAEFERMAASLE